MFITCSQEYTTCPILSQINPLHSLPPYFSKNHFNIMLLPTPSVLNTKKNFYNMGIHKSVILECQRLIWIKILMQYMHTACNTEY